MSGAIDSIIPEARPEPALGVPAATESREHKPSNAAEMAERLSRATYSGRFANLSPSDFGTMLRNFEFGLYSVCAPTIERILAYDGTIASVAPKRWRAVSGLDWEIATTEDSDEARAQADFLDDFYKTLIASSAIVQDMRCGIETLVYQLVQAQAMRYSAAEIVWIPETTSKGEPTFHARTVHCPLRFFEATTRRLRILTRSDTTTGDDLDPRGWIVAAAPGDPIALPTLLLFMLKMTPLEDWAVTVETYAVPFLLGKTSAQRGSPEWDALADVVRNAKNRAGAVVGQDVTLEVSNGLSQTSSPHKELIEYLDRALAALWRGGDLSTLSQSGDGVGANPQQSEMKDILKSDAQFVEGVLNGSLTKTFIELVFGSDASPKCWFRFVRDDEAERRTAIDGIKSAYEMGLAIPENYIRAKLGIPDVAEGDAVVRKDPNAATQFGQFGGGNYFANAKSSAELSPRKQAGLSEAEALQMSPLASALRDLENSADEKEFREKLKAFGARFPALAKKVLARDDVADALASALLD